MEDIGNKLLKLKDTLHDFIPQNTTGQVGHSDERDGFFIQWDKDGKLAVVLKIDGVDYKQTFEEFIINSKNK